VSSLTSTRTGVAVVFALNGMLFATFVSRLPDVRASLGLDNGQLGLLLLTASIGSVTGMPLAGRLVERFGGRQVVRAGAALCAVALLGAALGATVVAWVPLTAVGLFGYGMGVSVWDVAMNVEAAEVERRMGRTLMPRFHAGWSLGSICGSALGVPMSAAEVPMALHVAVVAVVTLVAVRRYSAAFLPIEPTPRLPRSERPASAWTEPRTLLIGAMVLSFAAVEGCANDWLSLGLIDGYGTPHWVGVSGFWLFTVCMFTGRLTGSLALDRWGRAPVLWVSAAGAAAGIVLTVYAGALGLAAIGIVVWGLAASLGFPVGMSAAADDPARAAARVSVVATIGYTAFLLFPPLLGALGDHVGTLRSLLVIAVLMLPAAVTVFATRPRSVG